MTQKKITALAGSGQIHPEASQKEICIQYKQESRIDSRVFAKRIGVKHKNLYALIQKHNSELRQLGTLPFQMETCSQATGSTITKYVPLNSDQFDYICRLVRGRNSERIGLTPPR
ncbi:hypothetical protein [Winslowiella iniecta]|uniref:hypothetical protein n=1 Tax=Winslowiella iniecta TaxID=1560201 RepID=UPI00069F246E|nr:hypothetical protein [Winslowiella iniecta]